jgi:hypothetical protein
MAHAGLLGHVTGFMRPQSPVPGPNVTQRLFALTYCVERIFLRKVGGSYIFIHQLLMEHFASLYTEGKTAEPVEEQRTTP